MSRLKFYLFILFELIFSPLLYLYNFLKWTFGKYFIDKSKQSAKLVREPVVDNIIKVCIHEWGGYAEKRIKKIGKIPSFECGLYYQLQRFNNYTGKHKLDLTVTLSDIELLPYKLQHNQTMKVSNSGMDFSGYEAFYNKIKNQGNRYVILTNSSVNALQGDFLDKHIEYLEKNKNVGVLGVSYNTKLHQSLIRNNFTPHLQSFYLITTTNVLSEIVAINGKFPGAGITHKLLLIKKGEIMFSKIVIKLGYKLACVLDDGFVYTFDESCLKDNGHHSWLLRFGDYRLVTSTPNRINKINSAPDNKYCQENR